MESLLVYYSVKWQNQTDQGKAQSRNGFDVNTVANKFGGGGHKYAAGVVKFRVQLQKYNGLILDEVRKGTIKQKAVRFASNLLGKTVDTIAFPQLCRQKIWMK